MRRSRTVKVELQLARQLLGLFPSLQNGFLHGSGPVADLLGLVHVEREVDADMAVEVVLRVVLRVVRDAVRRGDVGVLPSGNETQTGLIAHLLRPRNALYRLLVSSAVTGSASQCLSLDMTVMFQL